MGFLGRLFLGTGELPAEECDALRAEGLVLLEEGVSGSIRYDHFKAPGKRFNGKVTPQRMGFGISEKRVVVYCRSGRAELIDSPFDSPGFDAVSVSLKSSDELQIRIDYDEMSDAEAAGVSGVIAINLKTSNAGIACEAAALAAYRQRKGRTMREQTSTRVVRIGLRLLALGATTIVVVAPAQAGSPTGTPVETGNTETMGTTNGLVYRTAHSSVVGIPGQSLGVAAECSPDGERQTIGGGAVIPGGGYGEPLVDSGPIKGFSQGRTWVGSFFNHSGSNVSVYAYVICAKLEERKLVTETVRDAPAEIDQALKAKCPGSLKVSSGGVSFDDADGQWRISKPFDGGDADSKPDDGWRVEAQSPDVTDISAYAICVSGVRLAYRTTTYDGMSGTSYEAQSFCGEGEAAVGGGGSTSDTSASSYADGNFPGDFTGEPNVPEDYWGFRADVGPGGPFTYTSIAICKR